MKTSTIIEYGAVDVTAKSDSSLSVNNAQSFSQLDELKINNLKERKYSTLEKNHFVLDGKSENMGDNITDVGWWSRIMSDSQGEFSTPLVMTIEFSQAHSSMGLTLTFSKYDYCNNLKIQYYNASNSLIYENTYYPDNYDYFCEGTVSNYRKIVITFYSMNIPYRYLKLYKIMYGRAVLFEGDSLISANLLEQVNLLSDELSINTLDFVVYSDDDDGKKPVTEMVIMPKIEGAIITAKGASNTEVKKRIMNAVEAATGLSIDKIQVFEME